MRTRAGALAVALVALIAAAVAIARPVTARPVTAHPARAHCHVPGTNRFLAGQWRPNMRGAISYAHGRIGDIAFAVRLPGAFYGYRPDHQEWSASVLKAMLMVAYLDMPSVAGRHLNSRDTSLLYPMITMSDNNAANQVDVIVGNARLSALAARVGMRSFVPVSPIWGESRITARDQTKFFLNIGSYVVRRHRPYAMYLLNHITPSQRWGIGEVAPRGWKLYFKGGWGSGTGLIDHQVALFTRGCARFSIAVLTMNDGSHPYGKETLREMFHILLRHLPTGRHTHYP